jgi:hypothetical protein
MDVLPTATDCLRKTAPTSARHYAVLIEPGEMIWTGDGRKLRVVSLVPPAEVTDKYVGFLVVKELVPRDVEVEVAVLPPCPVLL